MMHIQCRNFPACFYIGPETFNWVNSLIAVLERYIHIPAFSCCIVLFFPYCFPSYHHRQVKPIRQNVRRRSDAAPGLLGIG